MFRHQALLIILTSALLLAACSDPSGSFAPKEISVNIHPESATLQIGEPLEFTATVSGTPDTSIIWSSSGGTIDDSDTTVIYTAPNEAGEYTLTATSAVDGSSWGIATIRVDMNLQADIEVHGGEAVGLDESIFLLGPGVLDEKIEAHVKAFPAENPDYPAALTPIGPVRELVLPATSISSESRFAGKDDPFEDRVLVRVPLPQAHSVSHDYLVDVTLTSGTATLNYPELYYPGSREVIEISGNILRALLSEGGASDELRITTQVVQLDEHLAPSSNVWEKGLYAFTEAFDALESLPAACPGTATEKLPSGVVKAISPNIHLDERTPLVLVTGWQTINNYTKGVKLGSWPSLYVGDASFVPQVCGWRSFLERLARDNNEILRNYKLFTYGYDSDLSIAHNGAVLAMQLEEFFGDREIVVLAHSMGGIVTNYAINHAQLSNVKHAITMGTPFRGTTLIHCTEVHANGNDCTEIMLNPDVKRAMDDGCGGLTASICLSGMEFLKTLTAHMATRQGDRDLSWQYGGAQYTVPNPEFSCRGNDPEFLSLCLTSKRTLQNPRLHSLNSGLSELDVADFFALLGEISPMEEGYYGIIAALLYLADEQQSDGITPVASGCLSRNRVDNSCSASLIPQSHIAVDSIHHSDLVGDPNYLNIRELLLRLASESTDEPNNPGSEPAAFTLEIAQPYCTPANTPAVRLSWTPSSGTTTYEVYRDEQPYRELETLETTFANTANITAGETYEYFIRASNSVGHTDTASVSVLVPSDVCDTANPPPDPPEPNEPEEPEEPWPDTNRDPILSDVEIYPTGARVNERITVRWRAEDPDNDRISCNVDFGDGYSERIEGCAGRNQVTHRYSQSGAHHLTLIAEDSHGGAAVVTERIYVDEDVPVNTAPEITRFDATARSWEAPTTVTFNWRIVDPDPGDTVACAISFDDGVDDVFRDCQSTTQVTHQYTEAGNYRAVLVVEDSHGGTDVATERFVITAPRQPPVHVQNLLNNPSFDGRSNWRVSGDAWVWNWGSETSYRTAYGYAALGVDWDGYKKTHSNGYIMQDVTLPAGARTAQVSFYYQLSPEAGSAPDFDIALHDQTCTSHSGRVLGGVNIQRADATSSYRKKTSRVFDVSRLAGESACFYIAGLSGPGYAVFRIDDVGLEVWGD